MKAISAAKITTSGLRTGWIEATKLPSAIIGMSYIETEQTLIVSTKAGVFRITQDKTLKIEVD